MKEDSRIANLEVEIKGYLIRCGHEEHQGSYHTSLDLEGWRPPHWPRGGRSLKAGNLGGAK